MTPTPSRTSGIYLTISYDFVFSLRISDCKPRIIFSLFCLLHRRLNQQDLNSYHHYPSTLRVRQFMTLEKISTFAPCFSQNSLWNTCGSSEENPRIPCKDLNTHRVDNQTAHLSNVSKRVPTNNHATSSKLSTFPQGLLRLRVFRVLFISFSKSSFVVVLNVSSRHRILGMLPLHALCYPNYAQKTGFGAHL